MYCGEQFSDVTKQYLCCFYEILDNMIEEMTNAKLTNSISHNFIVQMIPHHQAAIKMSQNILPIYNVTSSAKHCKEYHFRANQRHRSYERNTGSMWGTI